MPSPSQEHPDTLSSKPPAMNRLARNRALGASAILVAFVGVILFNLYRNGRTEEAAFTISGTPRESKRKGIASPSSNSQLSATTTPKPAPTEYVVHVAGSVKNPGVYHLKPETRA